MPKSIANGLPPEEIRRVVLDARRNLSSRYRRQASRKICKRFMDSREFFAAKTIACYLPMRDEIDTRAIFATCWRRNKRVFAPVTSHKGDMFFREVLRDSTLEKNSFGIWQPTSGEIIDERLIDMVVTPLVAFDVDCNRIGMGGGYFDRCFAFLKQRKKWLQPKLVALAFDCQKVEKIAANPWDIPLYRVFSD